MPLSSPADLERRIRHLEMELDQRRHQLIVPERKADTTPPLRSIDHGSLTGLGDDDHPQYLLTTAKAADSDKLDGIDSTGFATSTHSHDHGNLTGLGDDDHTQYVKGAGTVADNAIVRFDGTDGRTIQNSGVTIDDSNNLITTGGIHVGGTSDPGIDNLVVDGHANIVDYLTAEGGLHVGGTSDPGTDNLVVDGTIKDGSGKEYLKTPEWSSWTPTITWSGGTTDPTSSTLTYAKYIKFGKMVTLNIICTVVRGSGDRTYVNFTLPINSTTNGLAGAGVEDLTGVLRKPCNVSNYAYNSVVAYLPSAMSRDGAIRLTFTYEVA